MLCTSSDFSSNFSLIWYALSSYLSSDSPSKCKQTLPFSFTPSHTHTHTHTHTHKEFIQYVSSLHYSCLLSDRCWWSRFYVKEIKIQGGRHGDKTEEWAAAAVVMVRTFNFEWLEAWPEAFGKPLLDHGTESDRRLTNITHKHTHTPTHTHTRHFSGLYMD